MISLTFGADELEPVDAVLTLDRVAAVARIPVERVVACAQKGEIVPFPADHEVVAVVADERVGALAPTSCRRQHRHRRSG